VGASHFPFLLLFFIVNFVVDNILAHPPPLVFDTILFYTTSPFPKLLLYSFDMCKLSVQNGGKKKNHYYYNSKEK